VCDRDRGRLAATRWSGAGGRSQPRGGIGRRRRRRGEVSSAVLLTRCEPSASVSARTLPRLAQPDEVLAPTSLSAAYTALRSRILIAQRRSLPATVTFKSTSNAILASCPYFARIVDSTRVAIRSARRARVIPGLAPWPTCRIRCRHRGPLPFGPRARGSGPAGRRCEIPRTGVATTC
jgi:hypothetical protein